MLKLFKAWSVVDNFGGQDKVIFDWFVVGRQTPVAPYDELVENYDGDDEEAWCDQVLVNELLTQEEVEELRSYLFNVHNLAIQTEEVPLPVRSGGLSYGLLLVSGEKSFYTLADEEEYSLSFSVLGHYDANLQDITTNDHIILGTEFLENVFRKLNITGIEQHKLTSALNEVYDENGLYVQQKTKKVEGMKTADLKN